MAVARKCDVCGKFYEPYGFETGDVNGVRFFRTDSMMNIKNLDKLDCCKECLDAINEFIENRKENKSNDIPDCAYHYVEGDIHHGCRHRFNPQGYCTHWEKQTNCPCYIKE